MSGDDWQPGDLALCVRSSHVGDPRALPSNWKPRLGGIYRVSAAHFVFNEIDPGVGLWFEEDTDHQPNAAWDARDFRKIRPHTPDEEDAETIRLLNGAPVLEPARHRLRHPQNEAARG